MKAIIYGVGRKYFELFNNKEFVKKGLIEKGIEVVGFSDSDGNMWGKEVAYNEKLFIVQNIDEFQSENIDKIIITTEIYFHEIKERLIKKQYRKENILSGVQLFKEYLNKIYLIDRFFEKKGIEIGGPTRLYSNIYSKCRSCDNVNFSANTIWSNSIDKEFRYGDRILGSNWIADATDMYEIESEKYDFVLSSNNLEHMANPIKALKEFVRILKIGGSVLIFVPMKEKCFDHNREYTTFEHIWNDFINNIMEDDLSHLPEILENHDYDMDLECGGKDKFLKRAMRNMENRCLHHHVFGEECLRKAFDVVNLKVISFSTVMNNWLIIGEKKNCNKAW